MGVRQLMRKKPPPPRAVQLNSQSDAASLCCLRVLVARTTNLAVDWQNSQKSLHFFIYYTPLGSSQPATGSSTWLISSSHHHHPTVLRISIECWWSTSDQQPSTGIQLRVLCRSGDRFGPGIPFSSSSSSSSSGQTRRGERSASLGDFGGCGLWFIILTLEDEWRDD